MKEAKPKDVPASDVSWPLLLAVAAMVIICLCLLHYNVLYTEGEVMQGLFALLICLVGGSVLIGFYRRGVALWCVTLLGGSMLVWQAYQSRKWAMIHEDIIAIAQFAEESKVKVGDYPANLDGYTFKHVQTKAHIYGLSADETNGFRITYFMNDPGITYWYSSKSGFGYYPD
jgi:hypothetical protein